MPHEVKDFCLSYSLAPRLEKISLHLIDSQQNMLNGFSMNISLDNNRKINHKIFKVYLDAADNSKNQKKT